MGPPRTTESRIMPGSLTVPGSDPWYNASVPLLPALGWKFSRTISRIKGFDPRLAGPEGTADLCKVVIFRDASKTQTRWKIFQDFWSVRAGSALPEGVREHVLIAQEGDLMSGQDIRFAATVPATLEAALQNERKLWLDMIDLSRGRIRAATYRTLLRLEEERRLEGYQGSGPVSTPETWVLKRQASTAVGFWLIQPEVLAIAETFGRPGKQIADLSTVPKALEL
ncbi:hypothetical protein BD289DRAFT_435872 [Coniella lustricola]|uniref:Uncharacterized protein n=1 Tax=Coniella lustricola TaxID=2025994 RepID=A0A2T3A5T1_9PEZI|nr:hypothetical protein BD289DRAFT_435872 [Coniella lustricola]